MRLQLMQSRPGDARLKAELDQLRLLNIEKHKDVLAVVTPDERAEYELRFGVVGYDVRVRLEPLEGTEQEYRSAYPILQTFSAETRALALSPDGASAQEALTRRTMQQLSDALGADRALDFVWAGSTDYSAYARVAHEAGLPPDVAGKVQQLAAETGVRAWEIHSDATLTTDQKRAALTALQQQVQQPFNELLPAAAQAKLSEQTLAWFTQLGMGKYKLFPVTLSGRNGGATFSLDMPPRAKAPILPAFQRPGR